MKEKSLLRLIVLLALANLFLVECSGQLPFSPIGRNTQRLTSESYNYEGPRWSPSGMEIVFYVSDIPQNKVIYIMKSDGSQMGPFTALASDNFAPDWSPDGRMVAFASSRTKAVQIYTMSSNGNDVSQLTHFVEFASCPKWSPDSKQIAFCGWTGNGADDIEIYVMNADGTNVVQLTHNPLGQIYHFEWSPDSQLIVFEAENVEAKKRGAPDDEVGPHLFVVNSDGTGQKEIDQTIPGLYYPTWSPDGKQILYGFSVVGEVRMPSGFYLMNVDGSGNRMVLNDATCEDPNWSRTNNQLVFVCGRGSYHAQIFKMDMHDLGGRWLSGQ